MSFREYCEILDSKGKIYAKDIFDSPFLYNFLDIVSAIGSTNPRQILWHAHNGLQKPLCKFCKKPSKWHPDLKTYRTYCCGSCSTSGSSIIYKEQYRKRFGFEHHSQQPNHIEKVKTTNRKRFGFDWYSQSPEGKNRNLQTCNERYNGPAPACSTKIREKIEKTCMKKYGVKSPVESPEIQQKIHASTFSHFGVKYPLQNEAIKTQMVDTWKRTYYSEYTISILDNPESLKNMIIENGPAQTAKILGVCLTTIYVTHNKFGLGLFNSVKSTYELGIESWLDHEKIRYKRNDRKILDGKELDFLLVDHNVAIEFQGDYWHMNPKLFSPNDQHAKRKQTAKEIWNYDKWKFDKCKEKGIYLFQIWESDWIDNTNYMKYSILESVGRKSSFS